MKKDKPSLIKLYAKMSGDKKVRLGLTLSDTVRKVMREGEIAMKLNYGNRSRKSS